MLDNRDQERAEPSARPRLAHRGEHLEHEQGPQPDVQDKPLYPSSLLGAPRLRARSNLPVQIALIQSMQQTIQGKEVMKFGVIGQVDPYLSLLQTPDRTAQALARLKFNDRVFVRTEVPGDFFFVVTGDGLQGYIWKKKVFLNPPEPKATLHKIDPNESAYAIARKYF